MCYRAWILLLVEQETMSDALEEKVRHYLRDTLGLSPQVKPWMCDGELPYYLQEAFEWWALELLGHSVLLALDRQEMKPSLGDVRSKLNKAKLVLDRPLIYATRTLASYERRYLIEHKVPFVVPGNQLYLPDLGLDLREYFRQRPSTSETTFSPAAQAILTALLLRRSWSDEQRPTVLADALGYTPMTLSRAIRELATNGLITTHGDVRSRRISLAYPPAETWERALTRLRTPIKRVEWAYPTSPSLQKAPLAGLSALSHYTMLAEPRVPIRAVSFSKWKSALEDGVQVVPEWQPGTVEWQIWRYEPLLGMDSEIVDPLSLTLCLRDEEDERVQLALSELKERFPW